MKATRKSYEEAKASLACEGIYLTEEEDRVVGDLIDRGVDSDERARQIRDWTLKQLADKAVAAE